MPTTTNTATNTSNGYVRIFRIGYCAGQLVQLIKENPNLIEKFGGKDWIKNVGTFVQHALVDIYHESPMSQEEFEQLFVPEMNIVAQLNMAYFDKVSGGGS